MENKINKILEDLDEFNKNISDIKETTATFNEYVEAIKKEKSIIDESNKKALDKIVTIEEEFRKYTNTLDATYKKMKQIQKNQKIEFILIFLILISVVAMLLLNLFLK